MTIINLTSWINTTTKIHSYDSTRRENLGQPMENIFKAVRRLIDEYTDLVLVYPMHKNPKVRDVAHKILGGMTELN